MHCFKLRHPPGNLSIVLPIAMTIAGCQTGPTLPRLPEFIDGADTQVVTIDTRGLTRIGTGGSAGTISGDGRVVAFQAYNVDIINEEVFVHDLSTGQISRVSVSSDGTPGNRGGEHPALSGDGRFVAFQSRSTKLVAGDTNDREDIFVHDRLTGTTQRININDAGAQANADCEGPDISSDGRRIVFRGGATNLVPEDTNSVVDVFVRDLDAGTTRRVSVDSLGQQDDGRGGPFSGLTAVISANGRHVAFASVARNLVTDDTNDVVDVFAHDTQTGRTTRISVASDGAQGNAGSTSPSISDDGRMVVFLSSASTLATGTPTIPSRIILHDRDADGNGVFDESCAGCRLTRRIELAADADMRGIGSIGAVAISGDGQTLAFDRTFSGPIDAPRPNFDFTDSDVYVHRIGSGQTTRVRADLPGMRIVQGMVEFQTVYSARTDDSSRPVLSRDGRVVAYIGALGFTYGETDDQVLVETLAIDK